MQILKENDVLPLSSVTGKLLGTWLNESIFSTGNFMKSKHRWIICNENTASKLRHSIKSISNFRLSAEKSVK